MKRTLAPYDWFLITGVVASNLIYSFLEKEFDPVGSLACIAGVICVVLVAKGSIWNYFFGVINASISAISRGKFFEISSQPFWVMSKSFSMRMPIFSA